MTDQTIPAVTDDDRRLARDWAEHIINTPDTSLPMEAAAARVILHAAPAPPRPDLPRMPWPGEAPVPPNILAEGSEWDDADALARACDASGRDQIVVIDKDGDVSVWGQYAGWWATVGYEPFTILHTGKGVDQ